MQDYEKLLNEQQLKCVKTTEGAVLVIAGAGSGKTRVLTYRIAYLMQELKVSPYNILAITFTNKATKEMQERLEKLTDGASGLWVSTFHSFCARVLRRDIDKLGYDKSFSIYDDTESTRLVKRILDSKHKEGKNLDRLCRYHISEAKNKGLSPEKYANFVSGADADLYVDVYAAYEEAMKASNALDYDDLLLKTAVLFSVYPDVLEYYAERFRYIHIDEYQDTNKMQYTIVKMLSCVHGNVFAVGDEDQSIYAWRGADISNITNFEKDYPNAQIIKLERNYRSTGNILKASNALIKNNSSRYGKTLWTEAGEGESVEMKKLSTDGEEADFVVRKIAEGIQSGARPRDYAILVRLTALTGRFEERLTSYAIPYKVFGGTKFFERKEIKDVLAYCRLLVNPRDNEAFLRIVNVPKRGIGDTVVNQYAAYCEERSLSLTDLLFGGLESADLAPAAIKKLRVFQDVYLDFFNKTKELGASEIVKYIMEKAGFYMLYSGTEDEDVNHRLNLDELVNAIVNYEKENFGSTLGEFLQSVTLSTDSDEIQDDDYVSIATVHAVKGLEFDTVFVVGLEENVFPANIYTKSDFEIEEERRVMYVAMTRAQRKLYLTNCWDRVRFGKHESNRESRFLTEIKNALIPDYEKRRQAAATAAKNYGLGGFGATYRPNQTYFQPKQEETPKYTPQYTGNASEPKKEDLKLRIGQKVFHKKFGKGTVVQVEGSNVKVAFENGVGIKTLNVNFAPLEVLN
ncbi:MAG: UvrD-helicase domain-containing protein [Clostridia bacterium]|nr:UvrD-helicase domain-containing protein [Clostridia bacterium]